jgi:protein TonB
MVAGVSAAILVTIAAATISLSDHRTAPLVKPAVTPSPTMAANQRHQDAVPTRTHSMVTRPKTMPRPVQKNAARPGEPVLSMNEQLRTPTRLQVKASTTEEAPLPADNLAAGLESSDPIGTVFSSRQQPRLQIPSQQLITVPPDVALGLLIQKRLPVYPMIAQAAHVSGTIVLAVIISKTGTVENLRVVSGPVMLRDSAVNAVRTWHFKPYVLNAQPMAIETIINLRFSLHN